MHAFKIRPFVLSSQFYLYSTFKKIKNIKCWPKSFTYMRMYQQFWKFLSIICSRERDQQLKKTGSPLLLRLDLRTSGSIWLEELSTLTGVWTWIRSNRSLKAILKQTGSRWRCQYGTGIATRKWIFMVVSCQTWGNI